MEKYIYNKDNGLWYELVGDYYLPCVTVDEADHRSVGMWGKRHLKYLKENYPTVYRSFLSEGKLNSYLVGIDTQATEMYDRLVAQLSERDGITEQLKEQDQMEWVRAMNAIRHTAEEIVLAEVVYA